MSELAPPDPFDVDAPRSREAGIIEAPGFSDSIGRDVIRGLDNGSLIYGCLGVDRNYSDPQEALRMFLEGPHPDHNQDINVEYLDALQKAMVRRAADRLGLTPEDIFGENNG